MIDIVNQIEAVRREVGEGRIAAGEGRAGPRCPAGVAAQDGGWGAG